MIFEVQYNNSKVQDRSKPHTYVFHLHNQSINRDESEKCRSDGAQRSDDGVNHASSDDQRSAALPHSLPFTLCDDLHEIILSSYMSVKSSIKFAN